MTLRDYAVRGYGAACYLLSRTALLCGIGFVGNIVMPRSIDHAVAAPPHKAVVVDLLLLGLFAFQQSVMADPVFRQWWARFMAQSMERSTYVLFGSLTLFLLYWQWRTIPAVVWEVSSPAGRLALHAVYWLGWAAVVIGAIGIRHFDRLDLGPVYLRWRERLSGGWGFGSGLMYWPVRHPIMSGFVIAFWATPVITAGHLLFTFAATGYIVIFVRLEERELRRQSTLAAEVVAELSGTVFPVLRRATVYPTPSDNGFPWNEFRGSSEELDRR
ncbi:hypothetical protein BST11_26745 [Mycobacterium alsense]|uniref:Isoprenylcysteine carboxylmethyltransferase family protein n=1 Tax=Mycobacterium alsense TaxID=324058 RepID=A0AA42C209_9MYCO|nr:isoprenylcysteine carboxylmethyltransferase family protein [Mycobacterium alsense]MCV7381837.1 isoprenylcysteine carboxylmethyltransferase family protein [Mycobacterium alsense]OQZ87697.1 hypothetical protein BST11_26745 [Mycobacterium alsense]